MKSILVLAALALSAFAQQATIVTPTAGSNITGGSAITIEVHQDMSGHVRAILICPLLFTGIRDGRRAGGRHPRLPHLARRAAALGLDPSEDGVGDIIYAGNFDPQRDPSQPQKGLFQDFAWAVPADLPGPGTAEPGALTGGWGERFDVE
ncbi:hypothetical protein ONZ51_g6100 [Trametes cubensis]|uniref:Uncharacterized protein n=1 Tax=Trametes cubensis TaxID=1111947 RepID=A0AAD7TVA2_9APHY|nr:hypothetical protein ONZ51_g6100 [Trametes cubensis]